MKYFLYLFVFFLAACDNSSRQENKSVANPPFWNDIQNFKKLDSVSSPQKNAILFIGSSSFTNWKDVQDYFPGYKIINRGFGGSALPDQIRYADDIIFPYKPKQIVIYCGENDLASSDTVTASIVFERFKELFQLIRQKFADIPVVYISMKPSPSRRHLFKKIREANMQIAEFLYKDNLLKNKNVFIDVHTKMLNDAGRPIPEIFLDDSLHMNAKGYAIWQKLIEPHLLK